jgi:hypothetical protein
MTSIVPSQRYHSFDQPRKSSNSSIRPTSFELALGLEDKVTTAPLSRPVTPPLPTVLPTTPTSFHMSSLTPRDWREIRICPRPKSTQQKLAFHCSYWQAFNIIGTTHLHWLKSQQQTCQNLPSIPLPPFAREVPGYKSWI